MIDINKEAEEYSKLSLLNRKATKHFVAGHNSKATKSKILQAQIDVLDDIRSKMSLFEVSNMENTLDNLYYKLEELKEKLKQLQDECPLTEQKNL
jgi:hypothetical protein